MRGRTKSGDEFRGPCDVCGATESRSWVRGRCNACYVWLQKFHDPTRGLYGLTVELDGRIRLCRIRNVETHGRNALKTITLQNDLSITSSCRHRHLTPKGFATVEDLSIDDVLVVDGGYEVRGYRPETDRVTVGERNATGHVAGAFAESNFGYIDGGHARLTDWTRNASSICEECGHNGSLRRLERAHLNGDRTDNDPANLAMLCVSCHKRHDYRVNGRLRRWEKGHPTGSMRITSIEEAGSGVTYSVVLDNGSQTIIANGIATQAGKR